MATLSSGGRGPALEPTPSGTGSVRVSWICLPSEALAQTQGSQYVRKDVIDSSESSVLPTMGMCTQSLHGSRWGVLQGSNTVKCPPPCEYNTLLL